MENIEIGIIGGSGFYKMKALENSRYVQIDTPFGNPSDKILLGEIRGRSVAFLTRHGQGHIHNPSQVNYRANLFAMKMLNVKRVFSASAVGSLQEELKPSHLVIPDQFVDQTIKRKKTFFEDGIAVHVSMAEPTCPYLSNLALITAKETGIDVHQGGTYLNMEGPQFSSKAESNLYRKLDFSIIGMTQAVEAKLARELELCYVPLSFVTDYDCWHLEEEAVSVEMVISTLKKNAKNAERLIERLVSAVEPNQIHCTCSNSLANSIITAPESIPLETYQRLEPVLGKYIKHQ